VNERLMIRDRGDIDAIETAGLEAYLPLKSPLALLENAARRRPDHCALRYLAEIGDPQRDRATTYAELVRHIRQAANLFRRLGIGASDAVALLMPHVPSAQIALWGAEVAGRACPINPMLRPDHALALIKAAGAKVAVVLGNNNDLNVWDGVVPALRESGLVTSILDIDADAPTAGSDGSLEDLLVKEPEIPSKQGAPQAHQNSPFMRGGMKRSSRAPQARVPMKTSCVRSSSRWCRKPRSTRSMWRPCANCS